MSTQFIPLQRGRVLLNVNIVAYFEWRKDDQGEDEVTVVFKPTPPQEKVVWRGDLARELRQRLAYIRKLWTKSPRRKSRTKLLPLGESRKLPSG